jgi:hypothetical protein
MLMLEAAGLHDVLVLREGSFTLRPARGGGGGNRKRAAGGARLSLDRVARALQDRSTRLGSERALSGPRDKRQRCSVRVTYTNSRMPGHFAAHGRYLVRSSAAETSQVFGTLGSEPLPEALGRWQKAGDPRIWKIILSPELGDRVQLRELTEQLMARIAHDHRAELEWAAVEHHNTDHPHVHIALRSIDREGREIRFSREYLSKVIRSHAQSICTDQIGPRTPEDIARALQREVRQYRFTSVDRSILNRLQTGENRNAPHFDAMLGGHRAAFSHAPLLQARLRFLTEIGVTRELQECEWLVPQNLDWQMKEMAKAADRQRLLMSAGLAISDDRMSLRVTFAQDAFETNLRGRVLAHVEDENTGSPMMILEGTDAQVHFIRHNGPIQKARSLGLLASGHFVSLGDVAAEDLGDAESYLRSPEFLRSTARPAERTAALHSWSGWLGRYLSRLALGDRERPEPEIAETEREERDDFER